MQEASVHTKTQKETQASDLQAVAVRGRSQRGARIRRCGVRFDDSDDSGSSSSSSGDLSGTITIDGSSTVQPFAEAAAELFNEENPDVEITVGAAGTSGGFEKFCAGETDISDASRPIEPEEEKLCEEGGVTYTEFQVANDGISDRHQPGV